MPFKAYDIDKFEQRSIASPGCCIYCLRSLPPEDLTDEHVIPFALGHNTLIFKKASCRPCAEIIQRYEQEVLKKQLGNFRLQVDAPSRTKPKDRATTIEIPFVEIDDAGRIIRDLGKRSFAIDDAPLALNLWMLPEAGLMLGESAPADQQGKPWGYAEPRAHDINRRIAEETGARHVAIKTGEVNRGHFMRFLAKTAHAFAAAELGLDGFEPFLNDIILNRSDDLARYVGGTWPIDAHAVNQASTVLIRIGGMDELVAVFFQIYPLLNSPAYAVIVGKRNAVTDERIAAMEQAYR